MSHSIQDDQILQSKSNHTSKYTGSIPSFNIHRLSLYNRMSSVGNRHSNNCSCNIQNMKVNLCNSSLHHSSILFRLPTSPFFLSLILNFIILYLTWGFVIVFHHTCHHLSITMFIMNSIICCYHEMYRNVHHTFLYHVLSYLFIIVVLSYCV